MSVAQTNLHDSTAGEGGEAKGRKKPQRILIVDDGPDLLESMTILLELLGHTVLGAADGRTAVEIARRERPDSALIDIGLPDMDGYEVAGRLRADPATKHMLLVALTGYATPEHQERAIQAGFDYHRAKPIDAEDLQRVLETTKHRP